jgi:hypothetical protein
VPTKDPSEPTGPPPSDADRKAFLLRLPPALLDELRGWAAQDLRSLNGHLEWLLREAVARRRKEKGR